MIAACRSKAYDKTLKFNEKINRPIKQVDHDHKRSTNGSSRKKNIWEQIFIFQVTAKRKTHHGSRIQSRKQLW